MAILRVRNVDPEIVRALNLLAARMGVSSEAEHRAILVAVLGNPPRRPFAEVLASMPKGGRDDDFARAQ